MDVIDQCGQISEEVVDVRRSTSRSRSRSPVRRDRSRSRSPKRDRPRRINLISKRVIISNVPYEMKWQDIKDIFRKEVGEVQYVEMFETMDGKSRGTGIIEFKDKDTARKAIEQMHRYKMKDRNIVVREERESDQNMGSRGGGGSGSGGMMGSGMGMMGGGGGGMMGNMGISQQLLNQLGIEGPLSTTVFVSNLDYKVTWKKLKDVFKLAGNVKRAEVKEDKDGKSRGMGTVQFEQVMEAVQAISMFNNQTLFDRPMRVKMDSATPVSMPRDSPKAHLPSGLKSIGMGLGAGGQPIHNSMQGGGGSSLGGMGMGGMSGMGNMGSGMSSMGGGMGMDGGMGIGGSMGGMNSMGMSGGMGGSGMSGSGMGMGGIGGMGNSSMSGMGMSGGMSDFGSMGSSGMGSGSFGSSGMGDRMSGMGSMGSSIGSSSFGMMDNIGSNLSGFGGSSYGGSGGSSSYGSMDRMRSSDRDRRDMDRGSGGRGQTRPDNCTVIVKNLPYALKWQDLRDKFKAAGDVKFAEIKMEGGRSQGWGLVRFASPEDAQEAIDYMNRSKIDGREIDVRLYR